MTLPGTTPFPNGLVHSDPSTAWIVESQYSLASRTDASIRDLAEGCRSHLEWLRTFCDAIESGRAVKTPRGMTPIPSRFSPHGTKRSPDVLRSWEDRPKNALLDHRDSPMTDSSSSDAKKRKIDNNVVDLTELTEEDMDIVDSPAPVRTASIIKTAMSKPVFNVRGTHLDKLVGTVPVSSTAEQIEPTTSKVKSTTFDDDVVPSTQPAPRAEIFAPPSLESSTLANSRAAHPAAPSKDGTLLKRVQMQETLEKLKKIRKVMEGREDETTSKPLPFSHATKPSETNPAHAVGDGTSTDYLKGRMNDLTKKLATRISVDVSRPSVVDNLNLISRDSGISAVNSVRPHDKILPVTEEEEDNAQTIVDGGLTLKTKSISKDLSRDSGFSSLNAARPFDKMLPVMEVAEGEDDEETSCNRAPAPVPARIEGDLNPNVAPVPTGKFHWSKEASGRNGDEKAVPVIFSPGKPASSVVEKPREVWEAPGKTSAAPASKAVAAEEGISRPGWNLKAIGMKVVDAGLSMLPYSIALRQVGSALMSSSATPTVRNYEPSSAAASLPPTERGDSITNSVIPSSQCSLIPSSIPAEDQEDHSIIPSSVLPATVAASDTKPKPAKIGKEVKAPTAKHTADQKAAPAQPKPVKEVATKPDIKPKLPRGKMELVFTTKTNATSDIEKIKSSLTEIPSSSSQKSQSTWPKVAESTDLTKAVPFAKPLPKPKLNTAPPKASRPITSATATTASSAGPPALVASTSPVVQPTSVLTEKQPQGHSEEKAAPLPALGNKAEDSKTPSSSADDGGSILDWMDAKNKSWKSQVKEKGLSTIVDENGEIPEIPSDEESDDESLVKFVPDWASSPNLKEALERQERIDPDNVFGVIEPISLESVFKNRKKRMRDSCAGNWTGADRLTLEEEEEYKRVMGYKRD